MHGEWFEDNTDLIEFIKIHSVSLEDLDEISPTWSLTEALPRVGAKEHEVTPSEYIKIEREQSVIKRLAQSVVNAAYDEAYKCPLPANLRRADFKDNMEGTVLWKPRAHGSQWVIIEQVHCRADAFWYDGGLYFITEYFVEIQEE